MNFYSYTAVRAQCVFELTIKLLDSARYAL